MAVTLEVLRTRILNETERDLTFGPYVDNAIRTAITFHQDTFYYLFEDQTNLTLLANTDRVALPNTCYQISNAYYFFNGYKRSRDNGFFMPASYKELINMVWPENYTAYPQFWSVYQTWFVVSPTADQNYTITIDYMKQDASLPMEDTDTSIWFDDKVVDLIRQYAMATFFHDTLQDYQSASANFARHAVMRQNLISRYNQRLQNNILRKG